jgi:hypothetical protein
MSASVISMEEFQRAAREHVCSLSMDEYRRACRWAIYNSYGRARFLFLSRWEAEEYLRLWREQGKPPVPAGTSIARWEPTP